MGRLPVALPKEHRHPAGLLCSPHPGGCVPRSLFSCLPLQSPHCCGSYWTRCCSHSNCEENSSHCSHCRENGGPVTRHPLDHFGLNHVLAFQGLSPIAEVDATPVDFFLSAKVVIICDIPIAG